MAITVEILSNRSTYMDTMIRSCALFYKDADIQKPGDIFYMPKCLHTIQFNLQYDISNLKSKNGIAPDMCYKLEQCTDENGEFIQVHHVTNHMEIDRIIAKIRNTKKPTGNWY